NRPGSSGGRPRAPRRRVSTAARPRRAGLCACRRRGHGRADARPRRRRRPHSRARARADHARGALLPADRVRRRRPRGRGGDRMSSRAYRAGEFAATRSGSFRDTVAAVFAAYYWELRKLVAQKRSWIGLAAAAIVELVFLISIEISKVTPNDGPYADPMGQGLRHSGLALTPVVLKEIAYFGPAIIAALVRSE